MRVPRTASLRDVFVDSAKAIGKRRVCVTVGYVVFAGFIWTTIA